MLAIEPILIMFLFVASAFMSSAEAAVFSLSRFQLRGFRERFKPTYRKLRRLLSDPSGLLLTILMTNELINISITSIFTGFIDDAWNLGEFKTLKTWTEEYYLFPDWLMKAFIGLLISSPFILILCEATPKAIGARANRIIALLTVPLLHLVYQILTPLRILFQNIFQKKVEPKALQESEILSLAEAAKDEGSIAETELELIRNVFELDDTPVEDVFTPIEETFYVQSGSKISQVLDLLRHPRYSRIPVVRKITLPGSRPRLEVVGIIHFKDLVFGKHDPNFKDKPVDEIMRKPLFVTPQLKLNTVLRRMKQTRSHLAVVQLPGGQGPSTALGILTMDDILEALFDEILDPVSEEDE